MSDMVGVDAEDEKEGCVGWFRCYKYQVKQNPWERGKCHNVFKSIFLEGRVSHSVIQCLPSAKPLPSLRQTVVTVNKITEVTLDICMKNALQGLG